jgi:chromosome segregation ATPase
MSDDIEQVIGQAKSFATQFGALLRAADKLAEFGDIKRAEAEARQAIKKVQGELGVLKGERDRELQRIYDSIEAELRFKYSESEKLLADQAALRVSVKGLEDRQTELRGKLADLERKIAQGEGRFSDITNKLASLRTSLDR